MSCINIKTIFNWFSKNIKKNHFLDIKHNLSNKFVSDEQRAEEQTTLKPSSKYYGAQAYLNVYNPAMIGPDPQSNVIIKLFFGPEDSCCTTLAAGWAVSIIIILNSSKF